MDNENYWGWLNRKWTPVAAVVRQGRKPVAVPLRQVIKGIKTEELEILTGNTITRNLEN